MRGRILTFNRRDNAFVLSDKLDAETVQTLVDVALWDLIPEKCIEWLALKRDICHIFMREQMTRKTAVARDIADAEGMLQRALREEVVDHVIKLFPYVINRLGQDSAYLALQVVRS